MLRITRQTDYGIVLLSLMAQETERLFPAGELAEGAQLPLPMVSKILKILAREGLLDSQRGARGGYRLAFAPEEISVAEVITALEGPIAITECIDEAPVECGHAAFCPARSNWNRINHAIRHALEGISLAEMCQPLARRDLVALGGASPRPQQDAPTFANTE